MCRLRNFIGLLSLAVAVVIFATCEQGDDKPKSNTPSASVTANRYLTIDPDAFLEDAPDASLSAINPLSASKGQRTVTYPNINDSDDVFNYFEVIAIDKATDRTAPGTIWAYVSGDGRDELTIGVATGRTYDVLVLAGHKYDDRYRWEDWEKDTPDYDRPTLLRSAFFVAEISGKNDDSFEMEPFDIKVQSWYSGNCQLSKQVDGGKPDVVLRRTTKAGAFGVTIGNDVTGTGDEKMATGDGLVPLKWADPAVRIDDPYDSISHVNDVAGPGYTVQLKDFAGSTYARVYWDDPSDNWLNYRDYIEAEGKYRENSTTGILILRPWPYLDENEIPETATAYLYFNLFYTPFASCKYDQWKTVIPIPDDEADRAQWILNFQPPVWVIRNGLNDRAFQASNSDEYEGAMRIDFNDVSENDNFVAAAFAYIAAHTDANNTTWTVNLDNEEPLINTVNLPSWGSTVTGTSIILESAIPGEIKKVKKVDRGELFIINSGVTLEVGDDVYLEGVASASAPVVTINSGGVFTLNGGSIGKNHNSGYGGGVMVSGGATFNLTKGTVYGTDGGTDANYATSGGAAVKVETGGIYMKGNPPTAQPIGDYGTTQTAP